MSKEMEAYFAGLQKQIDICYGIAERARKMGLDPELDVESPQAKDLAGRVEKLVGPEGVAEVIRKLKKEGKNDDQIVFQVVTDILDKKIGKFDELGLRVETAIRVGLAIKTMGVVSAPLEGISKIKIKTDQQGNQYLSLYFAGPIRAAGGTTAALCVLIADYVRRKSEIPEYQATEGEIGRYVEEVKLYDRRVHLQYPSSPEELRFAVEHLSVEINGDATENEEVSAFRDLPRIGTNAIRGGACLVLNDGILLKAPKLLKIAQNMNIEGWEWLADLKKIALKDKGEEEKPKEQKVNDAEEKEKEPKKKEKVAPNHKFVADIIAGRPVFSHPSRVGGHRIRYGRSRNTGLAAGGFHPATMVFLDNFVAIGTQLRTERPGKSTSICPVDSIEPPIVKLKSGDVMKVKSTRMARKIFPKIEEILFLGDILFGYGEFSENNHKLIPSGYVEEWWALELEEAAKEKGKLSDEIAKYINHPFEKIPNAHEAVNISQTYNIPLHPAYLDYWGNLSVEELATLREILVSSYNEEQESFIFQNSPEVKAILEKAFVLHRVKEGKIIFSKAMNYIYQLIFNTTQKSVIPPEEDDTIFSYFKKFSPVIIKDKAPYYMGTRMGRPEKSERKSMKGVQILFPLSDKVGNSRLLDKAIELRKVKIDVCRKQCPKCKKITIYNQCPRCKVPTELKRMCNRCRKYFEPTEDTCPHCQGYLSSSNEAVFNVKEHVKEVLDRLRIPLPQKVKGIFGLTNEFKIPEPMEKGILRAKNGVMVYKTAEIRYDATDIPLTHFKPKEVGVTPSRLVELGYTHDYQGNPLTSPGQILELKVQDILLSDDCAEYFIKEANFLDEELECFYKMERYYHVKTREDLVGKLVVGLAPHTSAGIIGRIIGFSPARSIYAHPYWHAAKRRNCFPGDTKVLVEINGQTKRVKFSTLYEDYYSGEYFDKMAYVKEKSNENIRVYSFDRENAEVCQTSIKNVIKIPYSNTLLNFQLFQGRSFKTTPDHPVIVYSNGKLLEKKAIHVTKKDKFLVPNLPFPIKDGLDEIIKSKNANPENRYHNHRLVRIKSIERVKLEEEFVYSLHAQKYHTILVNDNIMTHQCDGDEDGIMLLLDPLLNFSRHYLPSKIGGRMDATLVIGTLLDPNEIDVEAHNVDTLYQYPLEFYHATERYATPNEVEGFMKLVSSRLGKPEQYEDIGFNIPTTNINKGPVMTAYKTYESMDDKLDAQLHLAKIIRAVDEKKVGSQIIASHFNPDIMGNLRKFSQQGFRCVKCNSKFRRPPLSNNGKCPKCNGNVILTVNPGGIQKYIPRAMKICEQFDLDKYTIQKMTLIQEYVESLTNNPRIKQQKLSDFF